MNVQLLRRLPAGTEGRMARRMILSVLLFYGDSFHVSIVQLLRCLLTIWEKCWANIKITVYFTRQVLTTSSSLSMALTRCASTPFS